MSRLLVLGIELAMNRTQFCLKRMIIYRDHLLKWISSPDFNCFTWMVGNIPAWKQMNSWYRLFYEKDHKT